MAECFVVIVGRIKRIYNESEVVVDTKHSAVIISNDLPILKAGVSVSAVGRLNAEVKRTRWRDNHIQRI